MTTPRTGIAATHLLAGLWLSSGALIWAGDGLGRMLRGPAEILTMIGPAAGVVVGHLILRQSYRAGAPSAVMPLTVAAYVGHVGWMLVIGIFGSSRCWRMGRHAEQRSPASVADRRLDGRSSRRR